VNLLGKDTVKSFYYSEGGSKIGTVTNEWIVKKILVVKLRSLPSELIVEFTIYGICWAQPTFNFCRLRRLRMILICALCSCCLFNKKKKMIYLAQIARDYYCKTYTVV
jgi:hypothetical protein